MRPMKRTLVEVAFLSLVLVCVLGVCRCSKNSLGPFQPEVLSTTDSFQLQATGVTNRTVTLSYDWNNTGTQATVNHSTTTRSGSARVTIADANGTQVYDRALVSSLNEQTAIGTTGTWKIRAVLDHYSGTLNFRVQKQ